MEEQITALNQLMKKYKLIIENLERQVGETKEKMKVVYEALKLLEQESVSEKSILSEPSVKAKFRTESLSEKYKDMGLNKAIIDIVSNSAKYLSGKEIYDELMKNGFTSGSSNIKRDVYIALYRLKKEDTVIAKQYDKHKKYMIKQNT